MQNKKQGSVNNGLIKKIAKHAGKEYFEDTCGQIK